MSTDEVEALKAQKADGDQIIKELVKNSSSWEQKTAFSQAKYLRKKREKYSIIFEVRKPTTYSLCEAYLSHAPAKICNLRPDSLALMLNVANINYQSRVLVVENTKGFLCGAVMEKAVGYCLRVDFSQDIVKFDQNNGTLSTVGMIKPNVQILREFNFEPKD